MSILSIKYVFQKHTACYKTILFTLLLVHTLTLCIKTEAQVYIKTQQIGRSNYHDTGAEDTNSTGSVQVIEGGLQLPVAMQTDTVISGTDTIPLQTVWAVRANGSYSKFNNRNMTSYQFPSEVFNFSTGLVYLHPLNKKWSMMATAGVGLYTASSHITARQLVGQGALVFIRNIRPNLKIGGGVALDNTFGFPMVYPNIMVDWTIDGKGGNYYVNINSTKIKAGARLNNSVSLNLTVEGAGALALEKDRMFIHQYYSAGVTPEFKVGKYFTIPITVGLATSRNTYTHKRTLSDLFSYMAKEDQPHFSPSAYVGVGIHYGL